MDESTSSELFRLARGKVRVMPIGHPDAASDVDVDRMTPAQRVQVIEYLRQQWHGPEALDARVRRIVQVLRTNHVDDSPRSLTGG